MGAPTAKLETVVIVSPFKVLSVFLAGITFVFLLIAIPSSFWLHADIDHRYGLWKNCELTDVSNTSEPVESIYNDGFAQTQTILCSVTNRVWVQISGSLVMICLVCSAIGIGLILAAFKHSERQERKMKIYFTAAVVFAIGAVSIFFALILFPTMLRTELADRGKDKWYFGWSYGLAWGATIFLVGALGLLYYDRNREEIFYKEQLYLNQDEENMIVDQEAKIKTLN